MVLTTLPALPTTVVVLDSSVLVPLTKPWPNSDGDTNAPFAGS